MQISKTYGDRIKQVLADWAVITEQSAAFLTDPRIRMIFEELDELESSKIYQKTLCGDGSPMEFCERISMDQQAVAVTLAPSQLEADKSSPLRGLYRLLQKLASEQEMLQLRARLDRHEAQICSVWVGADLARRKGIRIYCGVSPQAALDAATNLVAGGPFSFLNFEIPRATRKALSAIVARGRLRVIGLSFNDQARGIKLAFAYPLDRSGVDRFAEACNIPVAPLSKYMDCVSSLRGGWRHSRCGLALSLSQLGIVEGFTVYHYAAPYFRDDQEVRSFVLRLADNFVWNTAAYRFTSRLLDQERFRVRRLLGFTTSITGESSLRLYGQSGAYA